MNSFRSLVYPSASTNATGLGCRDSGLVQVLISEAIWGLSRHPNLLLKHGLQRSHSRSQLMPAIMHGEYDNWHVCWEARR